MTFLSHISDWIIPILIFYIVGMGIVKKQNIYENFVEGAEEGFRIVVKIAPTLVGLMVATGILRASGFLDFLAGLFAPVMNLVGIPAPLLPLLLIRMFSSSAATGLALDIFKTYGTDSYIGMIASLVMSCTETIFYTMAVYFMTAGVKKTRWTLPGALLSTVAGIAASVVLAGLMQKG